ncbi:MAG: hypothetical protein ABI459_01690 [Deltaproteobacteria bacterium]
MKQIKLLALAAVIFQSVSGAAFAQSETDQRVAADQAWSVFEDGDPKLCWGVATPRETLNADEQGRPKAVTRGKILLFITFRKGVASQGEISFAGGYPFAPGSTVKLDVGGSTFDLFTEGETGWSGTADEDSKIIAAMKKGTDAVLTGRSARGTFTTDTFSLLGVTAATDEAAKRCQ